MYDFLKSLSIHRHHNVAYDCQESNRLKMLLLVRFSAFFVILWTSPRVNNSLCLATPSTTHISCHPFRKYNVNLLFFNLRIFKFWQGLNRFSPTNFIILEITAGGWSWRDLLFCPACFDWRGTTLSNVLVSHNCIIRVLPFCWK
jgi:hypothetical protein